MELNLNDKRVLIAGASKGMGRATALAMASEGAQVFALARNNQALEELAHHINTQTPGQCQTLCQDITDLPLLTSTLKNILAIAPLDVYVHSVSGPKPNSAINTDVERLEQAQLAHLYASITITRLILDGMKAKMFGRIIHILSSSLTQPFPVLTESTIIRHSVNAWSKNLSTEVAQFGITCNTILPGKIATQRLESVISHQAQQKGMSSEQHLDSLIQSIPAKRLGQPEEAADLICFLSSERAGYVNGMSISIDGGLSPRY